MNVQPAVERTRSGNLRDVLGACERDGVAETKCQLRAENSDWQISPGLVIDLLVLAAS